MEWTYIIALGVVTFLCSLALTALTRRCALKYGFVDQPGRRKLHTEPVPLGGGIVIFWITSLPMIIAAALALWWRKNPIPDFVPSEIAQHIPGLVSRSGQLFALIIAATVLHVMGLIDDRHRLGPKIKLLIQLATATFLATVGRVHFDFFIPIPWLTTILSVLWMVIIINAFNFLDNMDGLSAGIGIICAAMILSAAWGSGQVFVSGLLIILIGALSGFLVFNFSPAKIFMGDAGSLLLGLLISVATIKATYYRQSDQGIAWFNTLMPLIVLAVPLYDFTSVTVIRLLQGRSPFIGDRQHFSHRLLRRGMSPRQAVLTIYLATAGTGLGAVLLHQLSATGSLLVFIQTILILLIIAILEQPEKKT